MYSPYESSSFEGLYFYIFREVAVSVVGIEVSVVTVVVLVILSSFPPGIPSSRNSIS